jgi:hypothetical protein
MSDPQKEKKEETRPAIHVSLVLAEKVDMDFLIFSNFDEK